MFIPATAKYFDTKMLHSYGKPAVYYDIFRQPSGRYLTYKKKSTTLANYDVDVQF